jgi:hypothetical protein
VTVALPADGRERAVTADPGWYDLSLDTSDGRTLFSKVNVKGGATTVVKLQPLGLDVLPSPSAQSADVPTFGGTTRTRGSTPSKVDPGLRTWLTQLGVSEERIADNGTPADVFVAPVSSSFSALLARERGGEPHPAPGSLDVEGAMLTVRSRGIFAVADKVPRRFPQRVGPRAAAPQLADQPVWVAAAGKGWREIAALPSLGVRGKFQDDAAGERDGWMPTLVVESTPRTTGSHVAAFVDTRQWAGLLAFLARRDFELGAVVMEDLVVDRNIRTAVLLKLENPLAAAAGELVAVATGRIDQLNIPEQWLRNLTNWFPLLPDGPVILARHLMSRGGAGAEREAIKALLLEAYRRGVPLFSLSVDCLAEGLADFAGDPEVAVPAKTMRRFAQLSDPTRSFTVLRVPFSEGQMS